MKRLIILFLSIFVHAAIWSQTARVMEVVNSPDGQSMLTCYLPEHPSGRAVVCCPGGGYPQLSLVKEGHQWAPYFNEQGIAFFVLKYRMPGGDRNLPLADAYQAIRTVRDSAEAWHVNPNDVGIMGFSAGGHLASSVSTHADWDARPDFSILFYPVVTLGEGTHKGSREGFLGRDSIDSELLVRQWSNHLAVRRHLTPPAIILLANDDMVVPPVQNGVAYYSAMRQAGNNCALHVYPSGGHGFGFQDSFAFHSEMLADLSAWLQQLPAPEADAIRVACIGNSITEGWGVDMCAQQAYPAQLGKLLGDDYWVMNFGVGGRTLLNKGDNPYMRELAWRYALDFNPDMVIIKLGTNDSKTTNWKHGVEFEQDMQQMVDSLRALPSHPRLFLCSPIPAEADTWTINDGVITQEIIPIVKRVAQRNEATFIDLHSLFTNADGKQMLDDHIHPTAKGASQLASIIAPFITGSK